MSVNMKNKQEVIKDYCRKESDTGSPEVQVALLTTRVQSVTEHLNTHKKDNHACRGLIQMVNRRRKLLDYLKQREEGRYKALIQRLGLRR